MKIIKHGKVIFDNGEIVRIEGWHVEMEGGTTQDFEAWIRAHYLFVK